MFVSDHSTRIGRMSAVLVSILGCAREPGQLVHGLVGTGHIRAYDVV